MSLSIIICKYRIFPLCGGYYALQIVIVYHNNTREFGVQKNDKCKYIYVFYSRF